MDHLAGDRPDPVERRRAPRAECGFGSAGEHGGHPPARLADAGVADRVDTAMQWMEPASLDPALDRTPGEAQLNQLASGGDAVLARGEPRDEEVR